jgi:hypothetical protein
MVSYAFFAILTERLPSGEKCRNEKSVETHTGVCEDKDARTTMVLKQVLLAL